RQNLASANKRVSTKASLIQLSPRLKKVRLVPDKKRTMRQRSTRAQAVKPATEMTEAKAYEEHSLKELRAAGYRITMPRVQVIRALADTKKALSAYAIHEKIISGGGKIDVVSVYRILSTLQEVGLMHHIGVVDGYFPC